MGRKKRLSKEEEMEVDEFINSARIDSKEKLLRCIKIDVKSITDNQKELVKAIKEKEVVICSGLAGTGKTFLSCAEALKLLKNDPRYQKIIIVKSVTVLKNEEIGHLKGGLAEKMEPFMYSFIHNFAKIIGKGNVDKMKEFGLIEELPIAYMRGINIDNAIVIIDEAQNISIDNIRTILTRLGSNCKMIFLGDTKQIDIRNKRDSSLEFLLDKFSHIDEIGMVRLTQEDVVRNPLIKKIEDVFDNLDRKP